MIREVLRGIDSLHKLGIMHRDLKPQNILVCMDIPDKPIIKIADLGLARNPTVPMMHKYTHEVGKSLGFQQPNTFTHNYSSDHGSLVNAGFTLFKLVLWGRATFSSQLTYVVPHGIPSLCNSYSKPSMCMRIIDNLQYGALFCWCW